MVLIYLNSEGDILTLKIYLYHNLLDKIGHTSLLCVKWKILNRFYSHYYGLCCGLYHVKMVHSCVLLWSTHSAKIVTCSDS